MPNKFREEEKIFDPKRKEERDKRFLMWTGTVFFMVVISVLVIFNLRSSFSDVKSKGTAEILGLNEIANNLYGSAEELAEKISELQEIAGEVASSTGLNEATISKEEVLSVVITEDATSTENFLQMENDNLTGEAEEFGTDTSSLIK
jgi:hypothetical protein